MNEAVKSALAVMIVAVLGGLLIVIAHGIAGEPAPQTGASDADSVSTAVQHSPAPPSEAR